MKRHTWRSGLTILLLVGSGGLIERASFAGAPQGGAQSAPPLLRGGAFTLTSLEQQITGTSRKVATEVVQVENVGVGLGSGVIATANGYIVTNNHVVTGGTTFFATFSDGRRLSAKLVGTSPADDLAVIKVGATGLPPARFGNSDRLQVGQEVLAIGNPLGLGETVTEGVVSAVRRTVSEGQGGAYLPHAIQTSAAINPGNSGGALVSLDGQVIGIPTLGVGSPNGGAAQGIGFAIPSNRVIAIVSQLVSSGRVLHTGRPYLGIGAVDATQQANGPASGQPTAQGVLIQQVGSGSPASRAGITPGDVIVSIAGRAVPNMDTMVSILADLRVGQKVTVVVQRPNATTGAMTKVTANVTLGELPSSPR